MQNGTSWCRRLLLICLATAGGILLHAVPTSAQLDSDNSQRSRILEFPDLGPIPGGQEPGFGPAPGEFAPNIDLSDTAGGTAGSGLTGGRRRTGRLPGGRKGRSSIASAATAARGMQLPEQLPQPLGPGVEAAPTGGIDLEIVDEAGPEDGITLDAAIERMMAANLDIRGLRQELSQADADILTAGLRTNPLIYMDSQFIPYGSFNDTHPGGPTQYDLNITFPLDVSGKRSNRMVVARMARTSIEAQFQDVVRRQIDNVCRAFVTLQSARVDKRSAEAAVRRQEAFLQEFHRTAKLEAEARADAVDHLSFVLERTRNNLGEATEAYDDARESLGVLLSLPIEETMHLEPRGRLRAEALQPPPQEELTSLALKCRPDVHAARLGVTRANAEVNLQRANRFDDVYLFYDPITIQDNSPFNAPSANSWAIGLTFSLPVFNRNQGNIARAQSNVSQTKLELSSLERRIMAEVRLAEREYRRSKEALEQIEKNVLPRAIALVRRKGEELAAGKISADDFQDHLDTVSDVGQSHRDALVRHRRAMLELNTAVGLRILP
jgi:cobalt-zinc-cadmium efflux system outer membrane protein